MASLAELYEGGRGVENDPTAALTLYRQALNAGLSDAVQAVRRLEALT
jgi:TPR repeat protein